MASTIELMGVTKAYQQNCPVIEDLNLEIYENSFTVLLGPSGCGKSTILRMIAGLEKENAGEIRISGKSMKDVAPGDRNIAMVFQNYALYPTMTVKENIEFGLKNMKVSKPEREKRILEIAEIVDLSEYLNRKPATLSGGQRQRVALARAIVKKPAVFLMDEPLSNLDAKLRTQLRTELIELHRRLKTTFVFVTHDQVEAMSMATDVVLLKDGKIIQKASPFEIYNAPSGVFSAQFIGSPPMNILKAEKISPIFFDLPCGAAYVGFRPECARLFDVSKAPDNAWLSLKGVINARELLGSEQLFAASTEFGQIQVKSFDSRLVEYGPISIGIEKCHLHYFDSDLKRIEPKAGERIA